MNTAADGAAPEATPRVPEEAFCTTFQRGGDGNVRDTRIAERWPDRNYGAENVAFTGDVGTASRAMLIRFELDSIPAGVRITSAVLTVHATTCATCASHSVTAHRITAPWEEERATWASFGRAYDAKPAARAPVLEGESGAVQIDVTALVRGWVSGGQSNHGIALVQDVGTTGFKTSESAAAADRPRLLVCYDRAVTTDPRSKPGSSLEPG